MDRSSMIGRIAAAASLVLVSGCIMLPARGGGEAGGYDREKEFAYDRAAVINALDGVLVKQGFKVDWKDPGKGTLSARKTGFLASDYGYNRFQKFCLFWGYAAYGTILLDARAEFVEPRKTLLKLKTQPHAPGTLNRALEEMELKLFLGDGPR